MIFPTKHTNIAQSLLGFGSYLLLKLSEPFTVEALWESYQADLNGGRYPANHDFDNLLLTLVFLYSIDAIEEVEGVVRRCN